MKILLATLLFSCWTYAASETQYKAPAASSHYGTDTKPVGKKKINEPSAIPCTPQQTRDEKLNDLAKLEGQGESHSTNCPAQGAIKEAPDAAPSSKTE